MVVLQTAGTGGIRQRPCSSCKSTCRAEFLSLKTRMSRSGERNGPIHAQFLGGLIDQVGRPGTNDGAVKTITVLLLFFSIRDPTYAAYCKTGPGNRERQ